MIPQLIVSLLFSRDRIPILFGSIVKIVFQRIQLAISIRNYT